MEPQNNTLRARIDGDQIRNRIRAFTITYARTHAALPTPQEIAAKLDMSPAAVRRHQRVMRDSD